MSEIDDLSDENTEHIDSVLTTTNLINAMIQYPDDTPVVLTFLGQNGALSEHGLEILAIVNNATETGDATVVAFVCNPSDFPFHIPTAFPTNN